MTAATVERPHWTGCSLSNEEVRVLGIVRDRARNLGSVFPYQRRWEANGLHLDPDEWRTLAEALERINDA